MSLVTFNLFWMTLNICLAIISVVFGWLTYKVPFPSLKILFAFLWLLFMPNTIYMLTDILHVQEQFSQAIGIDKTIIVLQYIVLTIAAFFTFLLAMYPFEQTLTSVLKKRKMRYTEINTILIIVNFIIAFGVVIGRVQRTNSWELFTNIQKVLYDIMNTISSSELLLLVIIFGIINNLIYFSFRKLLR